MNRPSVAHPPVPPDTPETTPAAGPDPTEPYDLVVIGGGIIGSGVARDAALRGRRVCLVEKNDYGWGTTARSTRLVHGGLRYLQHYDFALVREALRERRTLIDMAPHLVHPLPLLLPLFEDRGRGRLVLRMGLTLYDVLARANLGRHRWLDRAAAVAREPRLDRPDLKGAFLFYDAQVRYPERLVVENVLDLLARRGAAYNHTEAVGLEMQGRTATGVRVRDSQSGAESVIPTRAVLNVGGPWVTEVDSHLGVEDPALTRRTKGVHLLVDKITDTSLFVQCGDGERIIFLIPWGDYTLIGTTDTDYTGDNDAVAASPEDVRYLLDEANNNLDVQLTPEDIHYTWAGLRPLIPEGKGSTGAVSRRHTLVRHAVRGGPENLVSVVGGKITSFRKIAEEIVDDLRRDLDVAKHSPSADVPLPGGHPVDEVTILRRVGRELPHLTDEDVARLQGVYGSRLLALADHAATHKDRGHLARRSRLTREEVRFVVETEQARGVLDVLLRRTMLGLEADMGRSVVKPLAEYMATLLDWDKERVKAELAEHEAHVRRNRAAVEEILGHYQSSRPDTWFGKQIRRAGRAGRRLARRRADTTGSEPGQAEAAEPAKAS